MPVYCVYKIISLCPLCAFLPTQKEIVLAEASICLCAALDPPTKCGVWHGRSMVSSVMVQIMREMSAPAPRHQINSRASNEGL